VRHRLEGCLRISEVLALRRTVRKVRVGGVVTHRQRPGTAAGVIFFNLEDETGMLNVVVLPPVWSEYKPLARRVPALIIEGMVEYRDGVTNLVAQRFEPIEVTTAGSRDFR
jgi:error-prone DNA polymerase